MNPPSGIGGDSGRRTGIKSWRRVTSPSPSSVRDCPGMAKPGRNKWVDQGKDAPLAPYPNG